MFNQWLQLMKEITDQLPDPHLLTCPECGNQEIDFQYVGDPTTRIGYLDIWCQSCLHGIHLSRTRIPANATMISFDDSEEAISERIPNFVQVSP